MQDFIKSIKFIWKYFKDSKLRIIIFTICLILNMAASIITPIITASIIVSLTSNKLFQVLIMALCMFLIEFVRDFLRWCANYFTQVIYKEGFIKLQIDLAKSILRLNNKALDDNSSGVFIERMTGDASNVSNVFSYMNFQIGNFMVNVGFLIAIILVDIRIFLVVVLFIVIIGIAEKKRVNAVHEKDKVFRVEKERATGFIGETIRGVRDVKMLNAEKSFINELYNRLSFANEKKYEMSKLNRNYHLWIDFLLSISNMVIIFVLVYFVYSNIITAAIALVIHSYAQRLVYLMCDVSYLIESFKDFTLSTTRIMSIMRGSEFPKERFGSLNLDKVKGNFQFKNVVFGYQENKLVLNDLSFKVSENSTIGFVGKSGSGKTTIFNLLTKMYDVTDGEILIDGVNIKNLNKNSIRGNVTVISQNPYIFNLSIRDNLKLVKEDLTDEEMINACSMACLDEFINALPDRYDTIVGEGGVTLSGGQRQRLAIARAFIQKTKIILFDEATSALDNITQERIKDAINNLKNDYTILIIAHRLSTIKTCDKIFVLDNGTIVSEGTHSELLKKSKEYRELYDFEIEK